MDDIFEKEIYRRNIENSYEKLKKADVCILGLGGLGSNIAVSLARSGVGKLVLVDFDRVELSNLNRQQYFTGHVGMKKTDAIKDIINMINPFINVCTVDKKVDQENIGEIIKDSTIICEAFDSADEKAMAVNEILLRFPEKKIVSASGMAGIYDSNEIKTEKRMKNLYVCGDFYSDFEKHCAMMAPRVNICANHQANIVLRIIMGLE